MENFDSNTDATITGAVKKTDPEQVVKGALMALEERKKLQQIAESSVKLNFILITIVVLLVLLSCVLSWYALNPKREYFAADGGRVIPLIPMSSPYQKAGDVIQFSRDALIKSFTINFANWRADLENVRPEYTKEGFKSYITSLQQSGTLNKIRTDRMNLTITADTGVLTREGIDNGVYVWYVEVPIKIRLTGQVSQLPEQKFLTIVRVERVSTLDSVKGIGVGQIITKPL